jgi:group I intron endonuclease
MNQGIIYLIINKINDKKYVGQTRQLLNKRWSYHITESKTYRDRPLYKAMNKYGIDNFNIRILEECDVEKLNEREIWWINFFDSYLYGYNATTGGDYFEHSEETKKKISATMSEVNRSDEWVSNVSKGLKNKLEKGEKWGFMLCENKGGAHAKRKIQGVNIITNEIVEFDSLREAAKKIKGNEKYAGNIGNSIKNNWTAYGYKWTKIDNRPIKKPIIGYDKKTGDLVYEFESANKASLTIRGKKGTGLLKSLKNPGRFSWMGCYWYYKDQISLSNC